MADQAEEPLISNGEGSYRNPSEEEGLEFDLPNDPTLLQDSLKSPGLFVWLLTFSAGISGLLFGCKSLQVLCGGL
jgi:SP family myo-inositol transporter-like MFS transporter 13